jgi:hypothetical protein
LNIKKTTATREKNMGDANKYQKLLEPPTKQEKVSDGRKTNVIYGQCNKPRHSKKHYHWNPNSLNNKLKKQKGASNEWNFNPTWWYMN